MDEETVVYMGVYGHVVECYSARKKEILSLVIIWVKLKDIT